MFRIAVLSIALTLALGPNARVFCLTRCDADAPAPASSGCHEHAVPWSVVTSGDTCDILVGTLALAREDVRRRVSGPDTHHLVLLRDRLVLFTPDFRPGPDPRRTSSRDQRSLVTPLRI